MDGVDLAVQASASGGLLEQAVCVRGMGPEIVPDLLVTLELQAFGAKKAVRIKEQIGDESTKD